MKPLRALHQIPDLELKDLHPLIRKEYDPERISLNVLSTGPENFKEQLSQFYSRLNAPKSYNLDRVRPICSIDVLTTQLISFSLS